MEQIYLQVLGTGSPSLAPSLLLFFPNQRYLINLPPSTTRALQSHRLLRLFTRKGMFEHVFLTDVSVPSIGGLPGFLLTIGDSRLHDQNQRVWAHCVAPLVGVACALRFFVRRRDFQFGCRIWRDIPVSSCDATATATTAAATVASVDQRQSRKRKRGWEMSMSMPGEDSQCFRDQHLTVWPLVMDLGPKEDCDELSCHRWPPEYPRLNFAFSGGERVRKRRKKMPRRRNEGQSHSQGQSTDFVPHMMEIDVEGPGVQQISPSEAFGRRWSVAYVFKINDFKGKFDPEKAVQLGVFGANRGLLARGQTATLEGGRIVRPEEVVGPPRIGTSFVVVCCRSTEDIEQMISCEKWTKVFEDSNISFVIHLCPNELVCRSPSYLDFVGRFLPSVRHVLVTPRCGMGLTRSVFWQSDVTHEVLSGVDPVFFPRPAPDQAPHDPLPDVFIPVCPLQKILLNPTQEISPRDQELVEEVRRKREASNRIVRSVVGERLPELGVSAVPPESQGLAPRVVFLGTGAAMPSKYRNVASILLDLPEDHSTLLLDCGEGTVGQIWRLRGQVGLEDALRRLRLVWISHMHADHHVGIMELLQVRKLILSEAELDSLPPLLVVGPTYLDRYLRELHASLDSGVSPYSFFDAELFVRRRSGEVMPTLPPLFQRALPSIWLLENVRVLHPSRSYGLVLKHRAGWSLVYSGDTMPCESLVRAGRNATILIHEGSFGDDEVALARAKKHSTIGEALTVARDMNAKVLMVTHFSQRYLKIPKRKKEKVTVGEIESVDDGQTEMTLDEETEEAPRAPIRDQRPALLAVDLVEIPFDRAELFPTMMPLIESILRQDEETEGDANG